MDIRSINPQKYNTSLADALKKLDEFKKPEWVDFVKTGTQKQRPSIEPDFWQKRAASIIRQIYIKKIVGVQRLRSRYGGRKDLGMKPPHFKKSGGKIIRLILQQAESAGLIEKAKGKSAGRQLTKKGIDFLEAIAK
ncbi:40S ribosomal protein S19 [Candidatus Pacearchaeota archaeon]|nr:40S ribosomal protein S19 [Candidatus Pacearchaeota archaeon]